MIGVMGQELVEPVVVQGGKLVLNAMEVDGTKAKAQARNVH